jgi:hypothetical protein
LNIWSRCLEEDVYQSLKAGLTMITFPPATHREQIEQFNKKYDDFITQGTYEPFSYPWGSYGAIIVVVYLLISHQRSPRLRQAKWLVWALNTLHAGYAITRTRAQGAVGAYGVGLGMSWSILWVTTILLVHDGQLEFSRIEQAWDAFRGHSMSGDDKTSSTLNESNSFDHPNSTISANTRKRTCRVKNLPANFDSNEESNSQCQSQGKLKWQSYPAYSLLERLDWVMDLMTTFRGTTWNFRILNLPDLPPEVYERLESKPVERHNSRKKAYVYLTKGPLLRASLRNFFIGYIVLDCLKTLTVHDPYFRGLVDTPTPSNYPWLLRSSPIILRSYRLVLTQLCIYWALQTIFQLAPLFFVGILGSKLIGPRGEYWAYPREWGNYWTVCERGLAGWWGEWWHQTFRYAFDAISKQSVSFCRLDPKSISAKLLRMFVAFTISGLLHGSASHTSTGDTRPIRGSFLFFFLQPFGIIAQMACTKGLRAAGISQRLPASFGYVANFIFVHVWFYHTAPLLVDDVAKGGQLLYEPVPFSLLRGMGLGARDDTWFCWSGRWYTWHQGIFFFELST